MIELDYLTTKIDLILAATVVHLENLILQVFVLAISVNETIK